MILLLWLLLFGHVIQCQSIIKITHIIWMRKRPFATIKPCVILLPKMGLGMFTNFNIIFVNTINRMI